MTIPKKAGYSARVTFTERETRMTQNLVCTGMMGRVWNA